MSRDRSPPDWVEGPFRVIISKAFGPHVTEKHPECSWIYNAALVEIDPKVPEPKRLRIDSRLRYIKQIILYEWHVPSKGKNRHVYRDTVWHLHRLAAKFNTLYPHHWMAKEWPLPYILPPHRIKKWD